MLPGEVEDQAKKCMAARHEGEKFEKVHGSSTWPPQMMGLKKNLLQTTKMDVMVENNLGNDRNLLEPIRGLYLRVCGEDAEERLRLFLKFGFAQMNRMKQKSIRLLLLTTPHRSMESG